MPVQLQILGQAFGGKTFKLKFGHHGGNHPIRAPTGNYQQNEMRINSLTRLLLCQRARRHIHS
jgi:carbamoylphosphate synthase small subunit